MRQPPSIDAFGAGGFRISGVWRPGSVLILDDAPRDWRPRGIDDLTAEDFAEVIAAGSAVSEFVLLGAGAAPAPLAQGVREVLAGARLGLEVMSSEAAAKLYNVLVAQGRRFAAALIAV